MLNFLDNPPSQLTATSFFRQKLVAAVSWLETITRKSTIHKSFFSKLKLLDLWRIFFSLDKAFCENYLIHFYQQWYKFPNRVGSTLKKTYLSKLWFDILEADLLEPPNSDPNMDSSVKWALMWWRSFTISTSIKLQRRKDIQQPGITVSLLGWNRNAPCLTFGVANFLSGWPLGSKHAAPCMRW